MSVNILQKMRRGSRPWSWTTFQIKDSFEGSHKPFLHKSVDLKGLYNIVCYTAVFSVVTQRFSPLREERCVTTPKTAV